MEKIASKKNLNVAGVLLFVFAVQFTIMLFITEALYHGYSIANNYISDLGVGPTGFLFDTSISVLGIAVIASAFFVYRGFDVKVFPILLGLTGVGALLVGVFNESYGALHGEMEEGSRDQFVEMVVRSNPMNAQSVISNIVKNNSSPSWSSAFCFCRSIYHYVVYHRGTLSRLQHCKQLHQ